MTTLHLLRAGKVIAEITFERTPTDGSQPSGKVGLTSSLRSERELLDALASALIRQVDEYGPQGDLVAIELGPDDN